MGDGDGPDVLDSPFFQNARAFAHRRPRRIDIVHQQHGLALKALRPVEAISVPHVRFSFVALERRLRRNVLDFYQNTALDGDPLEPADLAGEDLGLIETAVPPAPPMQRDRDDDIHSRPQAFFFLERLRDEAGQVHAQHSIPPVLEQQQRVLKVAAVFGGRAMRGKGRGFVQACGTGMRFTGSIEKPAAGGAERRPERHDFVQAVLTEDFFRGSFEEGPADFAGRGKNGELEKLRGLGQDAPARQFQLVSDSDFSWHSMQSEVQGRAFSRFLLISFWQIWHCPNSPRSILRRAESIRNSCSRSASDRLKRNSFV